MTVRSCRDINIQYRAFITSEVSNWLSYLQDIEDGSASAISERLHLALGLAGRVDAFRRRLTVVAVSKPIGESPIRGDEWLLDGDSNPFYQRASYLSASSYLHAIGRDEIRDAEHATMLIS